MHIEGSVIHHRPVVDMCDVFFDERGWRAYLSALLGSAPRYLDAFAGRFSQLTDRPARSIVADFATDPVSTIAWLAERLGAAADLDSHVAQLEADQVRAQVLHGGQWAVGEVTVNDLVAAQVDRHPERLVGWAGVGLSDPAAAVAEARRALEDLGMSGLSVIPFLDRADVADESHDALWRLATERNVPVWIHSGQNFGTSGSMAISAPSVIDRIAGRHPELRIVLGHGAWPWVLEAVALMQRHPHVHLEFSSHDPAVMARPGSGWESLLLHGSRSVRKKVMFGSTSWTHGRPVGEIAARAADLPLDDDVREAWMVGNAQRLLGLDSGVAA